MENEDDLSLLAALLDDDSNDILTEALDEVEKPTSPKDNSNVAIASSKIEISKAMPKKEAPKFVIVGKKSQKRKAEDESSSVSESNKGDALWDKFSGLYVVNPLISSTKLSTKMEGRKFIPVSQIENNVKGKDTDCDWVTTGVVIKKLPPKTSSNGKTFGVWKLSDLGISSANSTVALFLFGEIYKAHWKISEGSVIAILNASILPAKEKNSSEVALTLDNPQKLMFIGMSRDFGHCLGHTRNEGKPCSKVVNKQHGEFCEYHVNTAYKKVQSRRMEFQSQSGPPKGQLMKKLQKEMSSSTFMYQGKMLQANSPPEQKSKHISLQTLERKSKAIPSDIKGKEPIPSGINGKGKECIPSDIKGKEKEPIPSDIKGKEKECIPSHIKGKEKETKSDSKPSEYFLDLMSIPTVGARNLTRHLHEEKEQIDAKQTANKTSASQLLKSYRKDLRNPKSSDAPMLGRGLQPNSNIFFSKAKHGSNVTRAKSRALAVIQNKGPIEIEDPNAVKKKRSPLSEKSVEQKVQSNIEESDDEVSPVQSKRRRLLGPEFNAFDEETDEGKRLINAKSLHVGQVEIAQAERQEKYFNELERKERLEDKMKAIKEISVKVYCCKKCNYIAESASDVCFKENHPLKRSTAKKRFFACKKCSTRTVSYGSKIPKLTCSNCGEMNYERTSMLKEKQGPKIGGETLLVRGVEHAKYLKT